jgi:hypothetical protein
VRNPQFLVSEAADQQRAFLWQKFANYALGRFRLMPGSASAGEFRWRIPLVA